MKPEEKIVITGMGAVTPIGTGVENYWNNLIDGACGIDRIRRFDPADLAVRIAAEVTDFRPEEHMPSKLIRETDAFTQFAFAAAKEALGEKLPAEGDRMGIVMGTAMSGIDTIASTQEILTNAVHKNVGPRFVPRILSNIAAAQIAIAYGITGPSYTLSTACASGGDAISEAAMLIMAGETDAVLVVGADSTLCPLVIYSLANARALSRDNDDPAGACRPFDKQARGFVMGEGGGALVIEKESHAKGRDARIYAELVGWANNNDAWHVTNPSETGEMAAACMQRAIKRAGISPEDIDYVNAHGTGARKSDEAEIAAMRRVFGGHAADGTGPAISGTKPATGHMMGACGITEVITCIKVMESGIIPPTLNLKDPISNMDLVSQRRDGVDVRIAMSNALGFGGQNASIIIRKYEG